jgi:hypothetical protein
MLLLLASVLAAAAASDVPSAWQGYYVGEVTRPGGIRERVEVDIFTAYEGQAAYIDFQVSRSQPERVLGAVSAVTNMTSRRFTFSFTDSANNRGRGVFVRDGDGFLLRLEPADRKTHPEGLYGEYKLVKKEPKGRTDRHGWSLGNRGLKPPPR